MSQAATYIMGFGWGWLAFIGYLLALTFNGLYRETLGLQIFVLAVSLDSFLFAVVCLGNVKHGECASSAAWDMHRAGKWQGKLLVPVIDLIFRPWMTEHCRKSWVWQKHLYE